jgi:hypothetical protein
MRRHGPAVEVGERDLAFPGLVEFRQHVFVSGRDPNNLTERIAAIRERLERSERSIAKACTDVFGSTVITLVVITSIARIGPPAAAATGDPH